VVWFSAVRKPDGSCCQVISGKASDAVAWGAYTKGVETTGWDIMEVATNSSAPSQDAGFAAGLLEGYATQPRIYAAFENFAAFFFPKANRTVANACVLDFVEAQWAWMEQQVAGACPGDNCTYWQHVGVSLQQARGVHAGYLLAAPAAQALSWQQVYQLTNAGDLEDLLRAFPDDSCPQEGPGGWRAARDAIQDPSAAEWAALADAGSVPVGVRLGMHCSGFVRLTGGASPDILTGHTTFNALEFMLRVYKVYNMPIAGAVARVSSFSARPGDLHSKDDWYALSSNLTVIETSLTVFNRSSYAALRPATVPCWVRVSVANRLGASAPGWAGVFTAHASGTHNNDWIVTDYNALGRGPGAPLAHRVEEMPGVVRSWDASPALRADGFLFSVNIPNDTLIDVVSGYSRTGLNLTTDPRARIFRRDAHGVTDLPSLRDLMTSNRYQTDPISAGDPCNAISARCDLPAADGSRHTPYAFGGIDAKLINRANLVDPEGPIALVQSGPSHAEQPAFSFAQWESVPHAGMPERWDFSFETIQPVTSTD